MQELDLNKNQVSKLPREIVNLQNLKKLKLQWNKMTTLPSEILELKGIELLDISYSKFGDIALELFEKSNLICLRMAGMRLTSLAPSICKLQNLQELDISDNLLPGFPKEILELKNITTLNISKNKFSELHKELWDNINLTSLNLAGLKLSELPTDIGRLQNLQNLDLNDNRLTALPPEIGRLQNLLFLNFSGNFLKKIPDDLAMLKHLQGLAVGGNKFTEFPEVILEAIQLKNLSMGGIILTGSLDSYDNWSVQYSNTSISEISSLPKGIGNLNNLEQLLIGNSEIAVLPNEIGNLCQLKRLYLNSNKLTALPSTIGNLQNLRDLLFSDNMISYIPDEIGLLQNLEYLSASNNKLSVFPATITKLTKMKILSFYENKLSELPSGIGNLVNLKHLGFEKNLLTTLPPEIGNLKNLLELKLSENQLNTLPPEIGNLKKLYRLNLNRNRLSAIPLEIGNLQDLNTLDLNYNRISNLPPEIGKLNDLQRLHLINNQLVALPSELRNLQKLSSLAIGGNPLDVYIPPEIISRTDSPQTIINYYLEHKKGKEEGKTRPLNEAKIIIVGESEVGKTSLAKRLIHDDFDENESKTHKIQIEPWYIKVKDSEIRLNVWDFGGQEIMHSTHQFFLTKRSIYLLVLNSRQSRNQNRVDYWLSIIRSFGAESPIIVVCNKSDEHQIGLDCEGMQKKYDNVRWIAEKISCSKDWGIDELREKIVESVLTLAHVQTPILESWFEMKTELENMKKYYINRKEYEMKCQVQGITKQISKDTLIGLLNDLGIVICYKDDPELSYTRVLNPDWVTAGVYALINSPELSDNRGILFMSQIHSILERLDKDSYPRDSHKFIVDMMCKFDLSFVIEGDNNRYMIPDLFRRNRPLIGEWEDSLEFQYHYEVLPGRIITRFMVRMHKFIHNEMWWRTGVVIEHSGNIALVEADVDKNRIFIKIKGPGNTRRDFLKKIRSQFWTIHSDIPDIKFDEKVPIPGHPDAPPVKYSFLLKLEEKGKDEHLFDGMEDEISISKLLNGVESPEERRRDKEDRNHSIGGSVVMNQHIHIGDQYTNVDKVEKHGTDIYAQTMGDAVGQGNINKQNITINNLQAAEAIDKAKQELEQIDMDEKARKRAESYLTFALEEAEDDNKEGTAKFLDDMLKLTTKAGKTLASVPAIATALIPAAQWLGQASVNFPLLSGLLSM